MNNSTGTVEIWPPYDIGIEDSCWILTASMIIFTMQTGKVYVTQEESEKLSPETSNL